MMKKYQNNFYLFIIHVLIQKEHNRQQADDWLWDTIPNTMWATASGERSGFPSRHAPTPMIIPMSDPMSDDSLGTQTAVSLGTRTAIS